LRPPFHGCPAAACAGLPVCLILAIGHMFSWFLFMGAK